MGLSLTRDKRCQVRRCTECSLCCLLIPGIRLLCLSFSSYVRSTSKYDLIYKIYVGRAAESIRKKKRTFFCQSKNEGKKLTRRWIMLNSSWPIFSLALALLRFWSTEHEDYGLGFAYQAQRCGEKMVHSSGTFVRIQEAVTRWSYAQENLHAVRLRKL